MGTALGTLALANLCSGIGLVLQAILGLIGGIMAFSKLGKGESGKIGGVLLSAGVGITLLATLIGIIIVAGIDETILPNASDQIFNLLIALVAGALLNVGALLFAFMAKPLMTEQLTNAPVGCRLSAAISLRRNQTSFFRNPFDP